MILRRDVAFDLDPTVVPRDWVDGDPYASTFFAALSLLFPEGERFFVDSVKRLRGGITDPELLTAIAGFVGQEAMHGREHRAFNDLLVAQGYREATAIDRRLRHLLDLGRRLFSPHSQLAITCALEHFTAILAERLLRDPRQQAELDAAVRGLWLWHAIEESEHKAVAFDVYRSTGGSYRRRVAIMIMTTAIFFAVLGAVHARLLATRGVVWRPWRWARGARKLWLWPGYFTRIIPAYVAYFHPGFHPDDRDTASLVAAWRGQLFGAAGSLVDRADAAYDSNGA